MSHARSAILFLALVVAAQAPVVGAAADVAPVRAAVAPAPVPETVSAELDGLPSSYTAASAAAGTVLTAPVQAPIPFAMVGLELPDDASARIRTSDDGRSWTPWVDAEPLLAGDDGPEAGSAEAAAAAAIDVDRFTEPLWVGRSSWLQVELQGAAPSEVRASFIDTLGLSQPAVTVSVAAGDGGTGHVRAAHAVGDTLSGLVTRAGWGADESLRKGSPSYATSVRYAVMHHTAGPNDYTEQEAPAVVRGIFHYHTQVLGWSDIGYNVLVDRYGNIYEGRYGGMEQAVIGAHAQGFNTGSLGVSVIGEFTTSAPPQVALDAVADVVAWSFRRHGVSPAGSVMITSGGSNKYPAGMQVPMSTMFGHRDAGLTACPGDAYYAKLPALRMMVGARVAGSVPPPPPPPAPPPPAPGAFSDIGGSVHAPSIEALAGAGVTDGCGGGRYCPDVDVTRAQAVSLLARIKGLPGGSGQRFFDVPPDHTHARTIAAAVDAGWIAGYGDGTFRPEALLNREQLATVLGRAAGLSRRPGQFFSDVRWASPHLAWVNAIGEAGISDGCGGGRYCPYRTATRGQLATLVVGAFLR